MGHMHIPSSLPNILPTTYTCPNPSGKKKKILKYLICTYIFPLTLKKKRSQLILYYTSLFFFSISLIYFRIYQIIRITNYLLIIINGIYITFY